MRRACTRGDRRRRRVGDVVEEGEDAFGEQHLRGPVIGRQAAVGEQVLVTGVDEQLGLRGRRHELAGGVEVAVLGEERVGLHPVNLDRNAVRPRAAELGRRQTGVEEHGALCPLPGLGQHLRGHHAEREAGIHDLSGQRVGGGPPALEDGVEAGLPGVGDPLLQTLEHPAVVEIRDMNRVPGGREPLGEVADPRRQPVRVVEQDHLSHLAPLSVRARRTRLGPNIPCPGDSRRDSGRNGPCPSAQRDRSTSAIIRWPCASNSASPTWCAQQAVSHGLAQLRPAPGGWVTRIRAVALDVRLLQIGTACELLHRQPGEIRLGRPPVRAAEVDDVDQALVVQPVAGLPVAMSGHQDSCGRGEGGDHRAQLRLDIRSDRVWPVKPPERPCVGPRS